MINKLEKIERDVRQLLAKDNTGHGFEHIQRVCNLALDIAKKEMADGDIVALAALLHDVDDYKLFGDECAKNLTNAKKIMQKYHIEEYIQEQVCEIIGNMGYSKTLMGIRPQTLEGKIVSDADMLDAIGVIGTIRCLTYALARCETVIFDENVFPQVNMKIEEYKKPNRKSDNFINHYFEKLLKIKDILFTKSAKEEAEIRHKFMLDFLYGFFREQNLPKWIKYLDDFQNNIK